MSVNETHSFIFYRFVRATAVAAMVGCSPFNKSHIDDPMSMFIFQFDRTAATTTIVTPTTMTPTSMFHTEVIDQTSPQPHSIQNEHFITNYFCMICRVFQINWEKMKKIVTESELYVFGSLLTRCCLQLFTHPDFEILLTFKFKYEPKKQVKERTNEQPTTIAERLCVCMRDSKLKTEPQTLTRSETDTLTVR